MQETFVFHLTAGKNPEPQESNVYCLESNPCYTRMTIFFKNSNIRADRVRWIFSYAGSVNENQFLNCLKNN